MRLPMFDVRFQEIRALRAGSGEIFKPTRVISQDSLWVHDAILQALLSSFTSCEAREIT